MAEPGVETRTRRAVITARATASFEPVGRSVAAARAFVRDTLQGWGHPELVDDAVVGAEAEDLGRGAGVDDGVGDELAGEDDGVVDEFG
uniref:hypothetical protein n=1 Tax=Streptomyces sp. NRRL B-24572 TaxID=1962156 RepID=UPI00117F65B2